MSDDDHERVKRSLVAGVTSALEETAAADREEILRRVEPWCGSPEAALEWYCEQELPGFGGKTAQRLVQDGRAEAVRQYLDRIRGGGYA